jgi:hypothetical protein
MKLENLKNIGLKFKIQEQSVKDQIDLRKFEAN